MWKPWQSDFIASSESDWTWQLYFMTTSAFMSPAYFYISIFFYPKYEQFHISALVENKSLCQEDILMEKSMLHLSHQSLYALTL